MKTRRRPADRVMAWLAATILCVLAVYAPAQGSGAADRQVLETLSNNQPTGPVPSFSSNLGTSSSLFVPVILTASGQNNSFFTSELTLTNRGDSEARLEYTYTAHRGGGSGKATEVLAPGQQKIKADALAYLRRLGIPIPDSGNRIGTLRVEVAGASEVGVSVRTTTSVPEGRAGLAYPGIATADGFQEAAYLCGLRQNSQDRSNVAFQNMGTSGQGNVTLKTTVYSGDAENRSSHVLPDVMLPPGGFHQYNGILNRAGFDNGYVKVERVEGTASFYAYGVINDQANSDGSFVFPVTASSLTGTTGQTLPVIVETGPFTSELTVTNFSEVAKTVTFRFRAEAVETADKTASFEWTLQPGQQVIVPDIVERMRQMGTAGIGPSGQTFAGALFAAVASSDMSGIVIGARTSSSDGRGGQYGVSYNAVPAGGAFTRSVWVDGLQQNQENRSNLALVNTGEMDGGDSSFTLEIYDGATGRLANTVTGLKVAARGWRQINGILGKYAPGTTQGYVRISKMSGNNPFLAYGVVNDGGALGQRSGDGAYLPAMAERIQDPGTEPMTDREVLEVFHYATGGPEWNNRTNWLSDLPLSEWFGVEIDGDGRVTSLILEGNRLIGAIPPVLSQLTRLKDLNLGEGNLLSGAIPPELGQLSRLQTLNLWDSQLSGGIPPELGGLTQLQSLSLSDNPLSGTIPPELGGLTQLQSLGLGGNQLSGAIPPVLGQLSRLKWLFLTDNQLSGAIPPELGGLTQLQSLGLGGNQLSGAIPPELGGLTQLQVVKLGTNRLSGTIPPELGQLTRLKWLFLTDNQLSGAIPPELGRLSRLHLLDLGGNPLSEAIPKNLQQLSELTTLNLQGTQVCVPTDAAFQAWLGMIAKFLPSGLVCDGTRRVLFLASSYEVREGESVTVSVRLIDQTGDPLRSTAITLTAKPGGGAAAADYSGVPESITIMPPLNEASFDFTAVEDDHFDHSETVVLGFRRPLPSGVTAGDPDTATVRIIDPGTEEVSDREALEALYHATGGANWINRTNWLSAAPLSEWFGVVTDGNGRVTNLRLPRNGLSGSISPALGRLTPLQELYLPDNQLTGAIPPELGNLSSLVALNLGGNQLTGAIPPELGQLSQLQTLNLRNNQLSGTIPPELAGLTQLQSLSLGGNQLSGAIPPELGGLTQLRGLNLGQNQLSGTIPPELAGLTQLQSLSLGGNQLSGAIPPELGGLTQLRGLNLGQNQLSGTIPPELGGLTQLQSLSLSDNPLSGGIPPELGGLTQLHWLGLHRNQLSGAIPPELGGLTQLQSLSLDGNQLSGAIPPELGGLTQLQSLSLGGNQLSGGIPPELGGLTQLHWLDLSFNQDLTGPIPAGLQQLPLSNLDLMATSVCIPEDAESQEWLAMIEFTSSGLTCGHPAAAMSEIDIAVFYTPAARKIAGGTAAMEAMIDLMIAETNPIYVEDGVNQRLVLVAREEVEYSGSGSGFVDLRRLADASDGYMDGVHVIREQVGADLIHLISYVTDVMGVADLAGPFGLTCASCGPTVFTHELGHNMGVLHDRYSDGGYGLFPYSHGYLNQRAFAPGAPKSARWGTIMAYGTQCTDAGFNCDWPGRRRFSNPNQTYLGDPIGVPGEERTRAVDGPADAVRTLNIMRHSLASFRPRASGNQLRMSSSFSQARPVVRTGDAGPAALVPGGNLFQVIAANGRAAASPQAGGALARATLRRREVSIDIGRLATVSDGGSMALRLNLFDDVVLTGMIDRRTPTYSGGYALSGQLAGVAGGSVTLVVNGSVVAGTVRIPGATYRIRPAGSGRHAILQVDPSQLPHECGTVSRKPGRER